MRGIVDPYCKKMYCMVKHEWSYEDYVDIYSLRHEPNPMSLWQNEKGMKQFNTQLRDLGYNAKDIGSNATKLAAVVRYIFMVLII